MARRKRDIYKEVTDRIISQLKEGTKPWVKSWATNGAAVPLRYNGQPYRGINTMLLWMEGRENPYWMSYKQASSIGGQVRGGERGTVVVFFKMLDKKEDDGKTTRIPLMRHYSVFNVEQIDGLPEKFYPKPVERTPVERDVASEAYIANTGAEIRHGGDRAFFSPSEDFIQSPEADAFDSGEAYYATLLHELGHWTGGADRLDRNLKTAHGTRDYAREELVAELYAAMISAKIGVSPHPRDDHADYLASWLEVLQEDDRAIFRASTAAQRAADFTDSLQPTAKKKAA